MKRVVLWCLLALSLVAGAARYSVAQVAPPPSSSPSAVEAKDSQGDRIAKLEQQVVGAIQAHQSQV